jgi:hypothetical protein
MKNSFSGMTQYQQQRSTNCSKVSTNRIYRLISLVISQGKTTQLRCCLWYLRLGVLWTLLFMLIILMLKSVLSWLCKSHDGADHKMSRYYQLARVALFQAGIVSRPSGSQHGAAICDNNLFDEPSLSAVQAMVCLFTSKIT